MSKTNHARVGEALELMNKGLWPFIEREFKSKYGDNWQSIAAGYFNWCLM